MVKNSEKMKIGIVFEGGGGKGAYQIGAWKAIRELGIDKFVTCVSGTSVGALNAALFYKGDIHMAEDVWLSINDKDILHEKDVDIYENGDCIFSHDKLSRLIHSSIKGASKSEICHTCYVTCRYRDKNEYRYFKWSEIYDLELKKNVLLASAAIPVIFESVNIDGDWYIDGGANGDNIPIRPLERERLDYIIVLHLSNKPAIISSFAGEVIEIFPSSNLGGLLDGTLDFSGYSIKKRINQGYNDAKRELIGLADICNAELFKEKVTEGKAKDKRKENKQIYKNEIINTYYEEEEDMVEFKFTNKEAKAEYELKLAQLNKMAEDKPIDSVYLWDETVKKYASNMIKVQGILKSQGVNEYIASKIYKDMDNFLNRCANAEFHIALVGAIKAGKSTLINALLGYEYASTKVTPETASLTKFRKGQSNAVNVSFYGKDEWATLWKSANDAKATVFLEEYEKLNGDSEKDKWLSKETLSIECETKEELVKEIQKWTSSKSVCHYFVKEVEVRLKEFDLPDGVVLVDTPGLDDVVQYRSNITRDYIDRANAVLVCVKSDALTGQEMATIYSVFANTRYNPEKVYIIATQVDTLNRPQENWKEQREEWLKYLKGKGAYANRELAMKNLIPVSAYLYTLLMQYNELNEDDDKYWDLTSIIRKFRIKDINEKYDDMLEFTNIEYLRNKINSEIVRGYKQLLVEDIKGSYQICKESIQETLAKVRTSQEEIITVCQGGIEEIQKKQDEYNAKYEEAKKDKKELDDLLNKLQQMTTQRANELETAIKGLAN